MSINLPFQIFVPSTSDRVIINSFVKVSLSPKQNRADSYSVLWRRVISQPSTPMTDQQSRNRYESSREFSRNSTHFMNSDDRSVIVPLRERDYLKECPTIENKTFRTQTSEPAIAEIVGASRSRQHSTALSPEQQIALW
jgi:hypothetical protein